MQFLLPIFLLVNFSIFSQNLLIKNTSFEKGLMGWDYGSYGLHNGRGSEASYTIVKPGKNSPSAVKIEVTKSIAKTSDAVAMASRIYLVQDRIVLKKGKMYKVTFYVKSGVIKDRIYFAVGSGAASNDRKLVEKIIAFHGNNEWQELSYTFKASTAINSERPVNFKNAAVYFGFDLRYGDFFLDEVTVERVKKKSKKNNEENNKQ